MRKALVVAGVALVALVQSATAKGPTDFAAVALNVLPPGQSGSLSFPPTATDQAKLYDGLTALFDGVTPSNYARYFKSERFGLAPGEKAKRIVRPRPGVTIVRDRWDVPHVYGKTRADVEFGAGYATAEDRLLLMQLLRGPGRIAALDVPNVNAFQLATSAREFIPTAQAEAVLKKQIDLLRLTADGRQFVKDADAYLAGVNAYVKAAGDYVPHWTRTDIIATAALIGGNLGVGGGDEARRSAFLSALQASLGPAKGKAVFDDLREQNDPAAPTSIGGTYRVTGSSSGAVPAGNVVLDDGSLTAPLAAFRQEPRAASNALVVGAKRSATGHPLAVMGPQVGYAFPEILLELDLHGGGIDARGAAFPGISFYILLGRGKDFAWSATSSNTDIVDTYVETLCGGDERHYMWKGECRAMTFVDAGLLKGRGGEPDRELTYYETVHGPVTGYATVGGKRVAITTRRATRGRESLSALFFMDLNTNRVTSPESFFRAANRMEMSFNWFYADHRDIAMFSSGRVPVRAPGVDQGLPTIGTGAYDWRGFEPLARHPRQVNPANGWIVNWNNKPGAGWPASDDNWTFGSVQRVQLLTGALGSAKKFRLPDVVRAMNVAATQDLRAVVLEPVLAEVLAKTPAPNARATQMLALLDAWHAAHGSRLDRGLDGKIDDPGAAIMDAAWPRLARAVLNPVLGTLTDRLGRLVSIDDPANSNGSSYFGGWYSYVDTDLRTLLGKSVRGTYSTRYCGGGDLAACSRSLWAALDAAGDQLAAAQGPDPAAWRADATRERITFGLLPLTMRWANRPTFQQVISFRSHR